MVSATLASPIEIAFDTASTTWLSVLVATWAMWVPALVGMVGPQEVPDQVALLTPKERQVLVWVAKGHSNKEIAEELFMAPGTVKTHLAHIYAKLGVRDRHEAMARAIALGLLG